MSPALGLDIMNVEDFKLLEGQAKSGEVNSLFKLAQLYRVGKTYETLSVPKNEKRAKELLKSAASKGHKPSLSLLNDFDKESAFKRSGHFVTNIFERIYMFFSRLGERISSVFSWLISLAVLGVIVALIVAGLAAIPVSIAIIVGAIIIAMAIRK